MREILRRRVARDGKALNTGYLDRYLPHLEGIRGAGGDGRLFSTIAGEEDDKPMGQNTWRWNTKKFHSSTDYEGEAHCR